MKKISKIGLAFEALVLVALICMASIYFTGGIDANFMIAGAIVVVAFASFRMPYAAYETIPVDQVRAALTNATVAIYKERPVVKSFLRSFFPVTTATSKYISIEVQRGTETMAVDVIRGAGSNKNQVTRSTRKTFLPPYFKESFNMNELDVYDTALLSASPDLLRNLAADAAEETQKIIDKIDRSYEKQCADAMLSGIISVNAGDNIDFRRKAASIVDTSSEYFSNNSNDPDLAFIRAGKFLREQGKINANGRYCVILGEGAFQALINNTIFQNKHDRKNIDLGAILPAQMSTSGASYHGYISVGSYVYDLWTYPEVYADSNGTLTPYIDDDKMIVTSYTPNFNFTYAQVPQLIGYVSPMTIRQGFYMMEYLDPRNLNHVVDIMTAGVANPYAIDQVFTQKVKS